MHRVIKPGGRILCLEFSKPENPLFRWLYDFYSFNIMPFLGEVFVGPAESYACLPERIRVFPYRMNWRESWKILDLVG